MIIQQTGPDAVLMFLDAGGLTPPDPCTIVSVRKAGPVTIEVEITDGAGYDNYVQLRKRDTGELVDLSFVSGDGTVTLTAPTETAVYLLIPYSVNGAYVSVPGDPWSVYLSCGLCIKEFPVASGVDIPIQEQLIEEMYERTYPALPYYNLLKQVTPQTTGPEEIVGEAATTQFDPIWGERVPSNMTEWDQAHLSTTFDPTEKGEYAAPVELHIRVQREAHELDLKKWGFDQIRDVLAFIPLSVLTTNGILVKPGDYFVWDETEYTVLQKDRDGWWKNTTTRLYMILNCEKRRKGS